MKPLMTSSVRLARAWVDVKKALFEYHQEPIQSDAWQRFDDQSREDRDSVPTGEVFPERHVTMPREPFFQASVNMRRELRQEIEDSGAWKPRPGGPCTPEDEMYLGDHDPRADEGQTVWRPYSSPNRGASRQASEVRSGEDDDQEGDPLEREAARQRPSKYRDYKKYRDYWRKNRSKYREKLRDQRIKYRRDKNKIKRQRERRRNLPKGRHRAPKPLL